MSDDGATCTLQHVRTSDSSTASGPWTTARYGAAAVAHDGDVLVVGGSAETGLLGQVDRYDVDGDTWTTVATDLIPRRYLGAVVVGDDLYVVGGDTGFGEVTNRVERVDLNTFEVEELEPNSIAREFAGVAVYDGSIWLAGGSAEGGRTASVERFDLETESWSGAPLLAAPRDTRLIVANGDLVALGGFAGGGAVDSVEVYDGTSWTVESSMQPSSTAYSAAAVSGSVWVFGDYDAQDRVLAFDRGMKSWEQLEIPFVGRRHSAAAAVGDDTVVVFGGNQASMGSWLDVVEVYDVACSAP